MNQVMRSWWLSFPLALCSCVPSLSIRPASGGDVAFAEKAKLMLFADPQAWDANPIALRDQMTPIAVQIVNRGRDAVSIHCQDFALVDDRGFRYAAISPFRPSSSPDSAPGTREPASEPPTPTPTPTPPKASPGKPSDDEASGRTAPVPSAARANARLLITFGWPGDEPGSASEGRSRYAANGIMLARHGSRGGSGGRGGMGRGSFGRGYRYAPGFRHSHGYRYLRGYRYRPGGGHHFYVYPYYRSYYGFYQPWGGALGYGFGYYPYVWGQQYSAYPQPPDDVLRLALPQGVVKSHGEVSGFLYFQRLQRGVRRFTLLWNARRPDGTAVATLSMPFVIRR